MIRDYVIPNAFRKHEWFNLGTDTGYWLAFLLAGDDSLGKFHAFSRQTFGFSASYTIQILGLVVPKRAVPVGGCHAYSFAETSLYHTDLIGAKEH